MKIQILSDLHLEFGSGLLNFTNADIVVLAGDVHVGTKGIEWILNTIPETPVIYVLGNHEYYKGAYPKTLDKIRDLAKNTNVHVLENEMVTIENINFFGATLWTDFSLFGNPREYGMICQEKMNDYKKIRRYPSYSKLRSIDTFQIHNQSVRWLTKSLEEKQGEFNIVITHHAPSAQSLSEEDKNKPISCAYASNLEDLIVKHQPNYWIHGHIHTPLNYTIGKTNIICNPHGYIDEPYNGYEKEFFLEIPN